VYIGISRNGSGMKLELAENGSLIIKYRSQVTMKLITGTWPCAVFNGRRRAAVVHARGLAVRIAFKKAMKIQVSNRSNRDGVLRLNFESERGRPITYELNGYHVRRA
jgi:hypothetical protein